MNSLLRAWLHDEFHPGLKFQVKIFSIFLFSANQRWQVTCKITRIVFVCCGWENKLHCLRFHKNQYLFEINPKYQFMKVSKRMRSLIWTNSLSLVKTILVAVIDITSLHVKRFDKTFLLPTERPNYGCLFLMTIPTALSLYYHPELYAVNGLNRATQCWTDFKALNVLFQEFPHI